MYVVNVDGRPIFATHIIEYSKEVNDFELNGIPFDKRDHKIICYSKNECLLAIKKLKSLNIEYTVIPLQNAKTISIDENIKFNNKTEIDEYLNTGKKPESKKKKDMEKEVEILRQQVNVLMDKLNIKY